MNKKTLITLICFIGVIVVSAAVCCGVIISSPVEITSSTAGNFVCNMMNDGFVLEDEGFLFYSNPADGVLWRAETNDTKEAPVKISDHCEGCLQVVGDTYYYQRSGDLVSCDYEGKNEKTVIRGASSPLVVGGTVYYLDKSGEICKYSMRYDRMTSLGIKPTGKFLVYFNRIYFVNDGALYTANIDGGDVKLFCGEATERFDIDDVYLFFTDGEKIYSSTKSGDSFTPVLLDRGDSFAVTIGVGTMIYSSPDGVFFADLNRLTTEEDYTPVKLNDKSSKYVYQDENYFYYIAKDGLHRVGNADGGSEVIYK